MSTILDASLNFSTPNPLINSLKEGDWFYHNNALHLLYSVVGTYTKRINCLKFEKDKKPEKVHFYQTYPQVVPVNVRLVKEA